ncbi:MAG TPA: hypothetical protein ENK10_03710 [Acidobacteria bacterium]|nr:hypothetical protein [Acidobacteriota bacterium]
MSRLLSQDEVDALLSSFDSEAEQPALESETLYDLRAPLVLAGDRLALVQAACEKLAKSLAEVLSLLLIADKPVKGRFTGISQQPATTVLGTLAPGEPLGVLLDSHEEPVGGITLQPELALSILDRVQGGDGAVPQGARSLSNVEKRLLAEAMRRMARHLDKQTALAPLQGGGLDRDPIFGRLATRGGTLAAAEFVMTTPHGDATCRLLLTPVLIHRLVADRRRGDPGPLPEELQAALVRVPIRVEPVIQGARATLADLQRLAPGQVLQLDVLEHEGLALRFNGELLAEGTLNRQGRERIFEVSDLTGAPRVPAQEKAS